MATSNMASGNSPLDNSTTEIFTRSYSERSRDFDGRLRRHNSESSRQSMKEKDYFRNQHLAVMSQLEPSTEDSSVMRNMYSEMMTDKQRIDRDISELRSNCCNQQEVPESGAVETFSNRYVVTINKYEALKKDYEALRQQYDDLVAARNCVVDKLDFKQEEINRFKQQIEQMIVEHNNVMLERNGLQQQCTQAVHKWDITLRERKELQDALKKIQQQFEEAMNARMKTSKDLKRLTEERNAAMQEYTLIMSERDTVHKEMEKLSEDLSQAVKKNKILENQIEEYTEHKKVLSYHIETLKREIASALYDRDKALKECDDFRQKFGEFTAKEESQREAFKSRFDYSYSRERDSSQKDLREMQSTSMDLFSQCQKETMHSLDQANQEIERLRKYIDKQHAELQEALQEAEVSKRRRDWAFNERDKIVLQRETLKTMYEQLRKERDRDKIDLAEALRDSDEFKRQLGEATKELQVVKEKIDTDEENRLLQVNTTGHNYSHDSAIDTDLQEWDTEIINIDLNTLLTAEDFGLELIGGRDDPFYPNDGGIFVSAINKNSVFDGKLKVNDCILQVNNLDCSNVDKQMLIDTICSSVDNCNIVVKRRRIGARCLFTTQLQLNNYDHGLSLDTGMYICKIAPGSLAAKEGNLAIGDRVLSCKSVDCDAVHFPIEFLESTNDPGLLSHELKLKVGVPVILIRNMNPPQLCNGTRLIITSSLCTNVLQAVMLTGINHKPMDGLRNVQDAMTILNQPADILVITTLKSTHCSYNCGGGSNRDVYKKYTNSSTQTEQRLNLANCRENRQSYSIPGQTEIETATTSYMNKWDTNGRVAKIVPGRRRFLKQEKNTTLNSSPVTFDQERDDALAELDSVLDSVTDDYHSPSSRQPQQEHRNKLQMLQKKKKETEENGGTWPKARMGPIVEHPTGTIIYPRKNRERLPLSLFLNGDASNYKVPPPQSYCSKLHSEDMHSAISKDTSLLDYSVRSVEEKDILELYANKKTSKYSVTDVVDSPGEISHSRTHSRLHDPPYTLTPFMPIAAHRDQRLVDSHYLSSNTPSSQSGESLSFAESRTCFFEPSYNTLTQFHHKHSPSMDLPYQKMIKLTTSHPHCGTIYRSEFIPEVYHRFEGGTFPRKKENQRFRIPSNSSVQTKKTSAKLSSSSIEKSSERGSPLPTRFHVDVLDQRQNKRNSLPCWSYNRPPLGQERRVTIENPIEPLGISIKCSNNGAVFVSKVGEQTLASQVGLQVGDQLLEVCGINMRNACYKWAERVLKQCGNNINVITLHVQYNPHKYTAASCSDSSATSGEDEIRSGAHSGSPTPCNSPKMIRKSTPSSLMSHSSYPHAVTTLARPKPLEKTDVLNETSMNEPRFLVMETHKSSNLGISLVGGNAVGIYVHSVTINSLGYNAGLRMGDHILEYNGTDLRRATAEEAAFELAKPADKVTILVQNEISRYNQIKDKPGDSFFIKALFDRTGDLGDRNQLQFHKDDILHVDNTMLNGVPGNWRASVIDQKNGQTQQWGIIPSKYKVEEDLLRRSLGDLEGDARRGTRRSFFRRKKQRNDAKELASFSNIGPDWVSGINDSASLNEETALASYQKVTRLNSEPTLRPVLIVGPLAECVTEKLLADYPDKFNRCLPEIRYTTQAIMEECLSDNLFIDYRKKGNAFECITITSLRDSINQKCHCILDINLASVKRLQNHHIYPIVLLIKFKSTKQIKEVKDTRYLSDKTSAKAAKEMFEHSLKLESEYRQHISMVIPAGVNVAFMCTQIKAAVDQEQNKTIWVPFSVA